MTDILIADFVTGLLVFMRVTAMIVVAPVFNQSNFPTLPKLALGLIITYILFFTLGDYRFDYNQGLLMLAITGIKEIITGILIGFTFNFVFYGISFAGLLVGFDMGLAIAQLFDPMTESTANVIGEVIMIFATLVFLLINGHHFIISSLAYSF